MKVTCNLEFVKGYFKRLVTPFQSFLTVHAATRTKATTAKIDPPNQIEIGRKRTNNGMEDATVNLRTVRAIVATTEIQKVIENLLMGNSWNLIANLFDKIFEMLCDI